MILEKIAASTAKRVEKLKETVSFEEIKERALDVRTNEPFYFEKSLKWRDKACADRRKMAFICEVKKASPSKGLIAPVFDYLEIAKDYESAGAAAVSVLTEPEFFQGNDNYLEEISQTVALPILRKDFTIDEYQIYEAKTIGASAVLLIASLVDTKTLGKFSAICDGLGLSAIIEAHDANEVRKALEVDAKIIGVNNRNLKTFEVNIENAIRLRDMVPNNITYIAESGIKDRHDIIALEKAHVNGVLIGEILMRSSDRQSELSRLMLG